MWLKDQHMAISTLGWFKLGQCWNPIPDHISDSLDFRYHICGNGACVSVWAHFCPSTHARALRVLMCALGCLLAPAMSRSKTDPSAFWSWSALLVICSSSAQETLAPSIQHFKQITAFSSIRMTKPVTQSFPFPSNAIKAVTCSPVTRVHADLHHLLRGLCGQLPPSVCLCVWPSPAQSSMQLVVSHLVLTSSPAAVRWANGLLPLVLGMFPYLSLPRARFWVFTCHEGDSVYSAPELQAPNPQVSVEMPLPFRAPPAAALNPVPPPFPVFLSDGILFCPLWHWFCVVTAYCSGILLFAASSTRPSWLASPSGVSS